MPSKPRVLLVPDTMDWALGTIAKQIMRHIRSVDFYLLTEICLLRNAQPLREILPAVDAVHWLNQDAFFEFSAQTQVASIFNVNHISDESDVRKIPEQTVCIVPAVEWKEYLAKRRSPGAQTFLVPYGVDSARFRPCGLARKRVVRRQLGIADSSFVVGFVGKSSSNDRGRKGIGVFLEAIVNASKAIPNIHALISGPGWHDLIGELKTVGIPVSAVSFARHTDLVQAYCAMDVYVVTSLTEGGPMTVLESMSCGVPTIATPVGLVPELIADGHNGFIAPKQDAAAVTKQIVHLSRSSELRETFSRRGRATVLQSWQWSDVLRPLNGVYATAAARSNPSLRSAANRPSPSRQRLDAMWNDKLVWADYLTQWNERTLARAALVQAAVQRPWSLGTWRVLIRDYGPRGLVETWKGLKRIAKPREAER